MTGGRMEVSLIGCGVVSPCGNSAGDILRVLAGEKNAPVPECPAGGEGRSKFPVVPMPADACPRAARFPRLRRASKISLFALEAAMLAFEDAGIGLDELPGKSISLVFAASDGGVVYTRRFFEGILDEGTGGGSPLLFPETVYNAPPSHVSASLGLRGHSLSLVGDSTAAVQACRVAACLLHSGECELALVLGAGEWDPVVSEGYSEWGITLPGPWKPGTSVRCFFTEGAGALLLAASGGSCRIVSDPVVHGRIGKAGFFAGNARWICSAATPSAARMLVPKGILPESGVRFPRQEIGEALCASTVWEIAMAARLAPAVCIVTGYNQNWAALGISPA